MAKGHGGDRKKGRDKEHPCHGSYKASNRRKANKLKKVLRSNGEHAWNEYKLGITKFTKKK